MKIIIVGNGPSATSWKAGKKIDAFDTVVRINRYITDGYQKYVGKKTDWWYTQARMQGTEAQKYLSAAKRIIWVCRATTPVCWKYAHKATHTRLWTTIMGEVRKINPKAYPSTGLLTIADLLHLQPTIHGFDFMKPGKLHYYDDLTFPGENPGHFYDAESGVVGKWIKAGIVKVLQEG